jgi:hypothetical protein
LPRRQPQEELQKAEKRLAETEPMDLGTPGVDLLWA